MSTEDLEIHQPKDTSGKKQYLSLKGSMDHGLDCILQRGNGVLQGRSLPSLVDVSSQLNEEDDGDYAPEDDITATNHKDEEKEFTKVRVEQNC